MKMSMRELVLLFGTLTVALFGGTAMLAHPKLEAWQSIKVSQQQASEEIELNRRLIEQRDVWQGKFDVLKDKLPQFGAQQKMGIHWMSVMDDVARTHKLTISKRQQKTEIREGDVYELPIECREWEGSLDAIVGFLYQLQGDGAMLDVREIAMKPNKEKRLRGRFLLHCAYTREAVGLRAMSTDGAETVPPPGS